MGLHVAGRRSDLGRVQRRFGVAVQHLWDHYLFTQDRTFLQWAYPIMKGAARFYADMLIEEPEHHWLVIAPANSPENSFRMADGRQAAVCMGPTMMQQQIRYLFGACIESSKILGMDEDFRNELTAKRARLAPTQLSSDGRIMEWLQEYAEVEPQHRHVSHLWGLYPADEISPHTTPKLAQVARKSLEVRGDRRRVLVAGLQSRIVDAARRRQSRVAARAQSPFFRDNAGSRIRQRRRCLCKSI